MNIIDITEELSQNPKGTFLNLLSFNGSQISACDIAGESPMWEMHPDTDEFFYILEGQFEMTLYDADVPSKYIATSGMTFVIPKGIWHKPGAKNGCKFLYFTPGQSLHSDADDPRI